MSISKGWNRSSAFTPEIVGALNVAAERSLKTAFRSLKETLGSLPEDQRAEAVLLVAQKVADGVTAFAETLKK